MQNNKRNGELLVCVLKNWQDEVLKNLKIKICVYLISL